MTTPAQDTQRAEGTERVVSLCDDPRQIWRIRLEGDGWNEIYSREKGHVIVAYREEGGAGWDAWLSVRASGKREPFLRTRAAGWIIEYGGASDV